jgi:hypothetical protein
VDDAGFAVDAGAFDDVVVEGVGFLLGDEGGHTGYDKYGLRWHGCAVEKQQQRQNGNIKTG